MPFVLKCALDRPSTNTSTFGVFNMPMVSTWLLLSTRNVLRFVRDRETVLAFFGPWEICRVFLDNLRFSNSAASADIENDLSLTGADNNTTCMSFEMTMFSRLPAFTVSVCSPCADADKTAVAIATIDKKSDFFINKV